MTQLEAESYFLQGARKALQAGWNSGTIPLESGTKQERKVYGGAIFDLLIHDDTALYTWLATGVNCPIEYYDFKKNKKGKLISCKARLRK